MRINVILKLLFIATVLTVMACPTPADSTKPGDDNKFLDSVTNVKAKFNKERNSIDISWDGKDNSLIYEVYRVQNSEKELILNSTVVNEEVVTDTNYPLDTEISYMVRSTDTISYSSFGVSPEVVIDISDMRVTNSSSSILEYDNRNRIVWDAIVNSELLPNYEVFRYNSLVDPNPVQINLAIENGGNDTLYLDDISALPKTTYYYQIRWKDDLSGNYGKSSDLFLGLFVDTGDENTSEPNNDHLKLPYDITFPNMNDLFIFKNGDYKDIDTFKIKIAPAEINQVINVNVNLSNDYQNDLMCEFIYKGQIFNQQILRSNISNCFETEFFTDPTSAVEESVYFRIIPTRDLEYTYDISYSDSY